MEENKILKEENKMEQKQPTLLGIILFILIWCLIIWIGYVQFNIFKIFSLLW
jgi:cell division septal protein FtsQ